MSVARRCRFLPLTLALLPASAWSIGDVSFLPVDDYSQRWSLAITGRLQTSPYDHKDTHADVIPLLAYSGETLFLAGTKAGVRLLRDDDWRANLYAAYRFAGYEDQAGSRRDDMSRDNGIDAGFDLTRVTSLGDFTFDITSDVASKSNGQVVSLFWGRQYEHGRWKILPWIGGSWYSADYNRYYYGVESHEARPNRPAYASDDTVHLRIGSDIRYRIDHIQYLTFNMEYERLGDDIHNSPIVDQRHLFKVGINYRLEFSEENIEPSGRSYDFLTSKRRPWSYRLAAGTTTDTKLNQIVRGSHVEFDDTQTKLVSFFGGKQLMRTFFGTNWEVWGNLGVAYRLEEPYQDNFFEYVAAIKFFYSNFPWSHRVLTRFGAAEGVSYADRVPYAETSKKDASNKGTSHLLNYLDFSFDANLGDLFNSHSVRHCFGGFSVHHRSGIFGSADLFGPVDGGSNVNTLYVECLYN